MKDSNIKNALFIKILGYEQVLTIICQSKVNEYKKYYIVNAMLIWS